jgi:hypothetical protein
MNESKNRVFIVGAGFSHHLSGGRFPLGNKLADIARGLNIDELDRHFQECNHEPSSLEEVLTRLALDRCIYKDRKEEIEKKVFLAVQKSMTVESLGDFNLDNSKRLVKKMFGQDNVIITTNYDLLLDHLLDSTGLWSPLGNGYGKAIEEDEFPTEKINQQKKNIRLLKVHGSFNFFLQEKVRGGRSELISLLVNDTHQDYLDRDDLFESAQHYHRDVGNADNLRANVLPTFIKPFAQNRTAMKMWHDAQEAMRHASVISIIGYSFPAPDQMVHFLMSSPDANEFERNGQMLRINILNINNEIKSIRERVENCLRANPQNHIEWGEFVLDTNNPDKAYNEFIEANA